MSTPSVWSAIKKFGSLLSRHEKFQWVGIIIFAIGTSILEIITALTIVVFARLLTQPESGNKYLNILGLTNYHLTSTQMLLYIAAICGITYLIKNTLAAFEVFNQSFAVQQMEYQLKRKLLLHYSEMDYGFYLTRNSSLGAEVIGREVEQVFSIGIVSLAMALSEIVVFLCLISLCVILSPFLALLIFCVGGVIGVLTNRILFPLFYRWGQKLKQAHLSGTQNLLQFFHAFKEIILLGKKEVFIQAYQQHAQQKSRARALEIATNCLPRIVLEVLFVGLFVTVVIFMCLRGDIPAQMISILAGYLYVGFRLMPGLNRMITHLNNFKFNIPAIENIYDECQIQPQKQSYLDIPYFTFNNNIILQTVAFSYPNIAKEALKDISLLIQKGEKIGIVGTTGSGKSTLVDLILGILKPAAGTILVDQQFPVNSQQWHQMIGYVPQVIYLLDDTIEANIAFGEQRSEIDVVRLNKAIDDAQLRYFIEQLPEGIKTVVGERGMRLSGGERQRIAIARALYRNPEVLVFDEATSSLDNETEDRLMETIHQVSKYRTVIMIAHRLSTLKDCDRIVVMQKGRIVEVTQYSQLNNRKIYD